MNRKEERLDEILIRLGYITEAEIKQGLLRQKAHGGRLGSHLLYFKFITEDELVQALSAQHGIPGFRLDEHDISRKAVKKLPIEIAEDYHVLPIAWDSSRREVKIAVVDPTDTEMIHRVKQAFKARKVELFVAPESLLRILTTQYYRGKTKDPEPSRIVELPELFKGGAPSGNGKRARPKAGERERPRVLMMTKSASLKNFLAPVFEREGVDMDIASSDDELKECVKNHRYDRVLVSQEMNEHFNQFIRKNKPSLGNAEISTFPSVSGVFMENPIPYHRVSRSLFRAMQVIAEDRCRDYEWTPPYVLICNDIQRLGRAFGFSRLAVDGMQIAAYLLVPERPRTRRSGETIAPNQMTFVDFDRSLEIAKSLHFPWNVSGTLHAFLELISEIRAFDDGRQPDDETIVASQILAIVWYHRVALRAVEGTPAEVAAAAKPMLRNQAGRLADLEVVEAYLRLLEHNSDEQATAYNQIFVVTESDEMKDQFIARLNRAGFYSLHVKSIEDARKMCDRHPPAAIIIDRDSFPSAIMQASGTFKLNGIVLLYAYTRDREPSLTLDLLDAGYDDVFAPPLDFDVITARITKSLRGLMRKGGASQSGGFSAGFKAFSFIDLLQTLGQALKTVRIDLSNSQGASATIYLDRGRMSYAACGGIEGEDAIYQVIRWDDDGTFFVEPTDDLPPPNITEANESILMEGCRLLDESRI